MLKAQTNFKARHLMRKRETEAVPFSRRGDEVLGASYKSNNCLSLTLVLQVVPLSRLCSRRRLFTGFLLHPILVTSSYTFLLHSAQQSQIPSMHRLLLAQSPLQSPPKTTTTPWPAQLVEQETLRQEVLGSSPVSGAISPLKCTAEDIK